MNQFSPNIKQYKSPRLIKCSQSQLILSELNISDQMGNKICRPQQGYLQSERIIDIKRIKIEPGYKSVKAAAKDIKKATQKIVGKIVDTKDDKKTCLGGAILISPDLVLMPTKNQTQETIIQSIKTLTFCLGIKGIDEKQYEVKDFIIPTSIQGGGDTVNDYIIIQLKQITEVLGFIGLKADFTSIGDGESLGILGFQDYSNDLIDSSIGIRWSSTSDIQSDIIRNLEESIDLWPNGAPLIHISSDGALNIVGIHKGNSEQSKKISSGQHTFITSDIMEGIKEKVKEMKAIQFLIAEQSEQTIVEPQEEKSPSEIHLKKGRSLKSEGKLEEAAESLRKSIELDRNNYDAYSDLGQVLDVMNKSQQAIYYLTKAIKLNPQHPDSHNNYGYLMQKLGYSEKAKEHYNKAIYFKPQHCMAYNNLACVLEKEGKFQEALEIFKKARDLEPFNFMPWSNMGFLLHKMGRYDEAVECDQKAIELNPSHKFTHNSLAMTLFSLNRRSQAINEFRNVISLDPKNSDALNNLGFALCKDGKMREGYEFFCKAIKQCPSNPKYYNNLILSLSSREQKKEGLQFLSKIKENYPGCTETIQAYSRLKQILLEQQQF